jgi:hypothetical protein
MVVWATLPGRLGKESCKLGISAWLVGQFSKYISKNHCFTLKKEDAAHCTYGSVSQ